MATAVFTTVEARVDQQLTNAIWEDEIRSNINQLASAHNNQITNGGMEQWQRGVGPFTTAAAYTADRWLISAITAGTVTVTKETGTVDGSASSMKVVTTVGSVNNIILQKVETAEGRGKTWAVSLRIVQTVPSGVSLELTAASGSSIAVTSVTTGSWVTLSATFTLATTDANVQVLLRFPQAGTYYVDNVMLVVGPAPAPYSSLHPQDDMARCQRYYEVHGGVNPSMGVVAYNAAAATIQQIIPFAVTKAGTPTLTKNGTWAVNNCGQPAVSNPCPSSYALGAVVTALGSASFVTNSTDDSVTAEYNV